MPASRRRAGSPTPDSSSSWGVLTAPAASTTSRRARTVSSRPSPQAQADAAIALEQQFTRVGAGQHLKIGALAHRPQEGLEVFQRQPPRWFT